MAEQSNYKKYYLAPGFIYVAEEQTVITTVLGSCVSVCLYDNDKKFGGMNHYLQPKYIDGGNYSTKFGNIAVYTLYKIFLEFGSKKEDLTASIIGGGYIENSSDSKYVACENIKIAKDILSKLSIDIKFEDTGGTMGRKVIYYTDINDVEIINLKRIDADYIKTIDKIGIL